MRKSLVFVLSAILLFIASAVTFAADVKVFGRVNFRYDHSIQVPDGQEGGSFTATSIRLGAKGKLADSVSYYVRFSAKGSATSLNAGLDYAFIGLHFAPVNIIAGVIPSGFTRAVSNGTVFADDSLAYAVVGLHRIAGLKVGTSLLDKKLHIGLFFGNSPAATLNASPSTADFKLGKDDNYLVGLNLRFDPLGKWGGGEWLQTSDMKATVGVGLVFVPMMGSETVAAKDGNGTLKLTADVGFTYSLLFLSVDLYVNMDNLQDDADSMTDLGLKVDLGVTVNMLPGIDIVPALRFTWIDRDLNKSEVKNADDFMRLTIAIALYPGKLGNKLAITPEFGFDLAREADAVKQSYARVNFMLNF